MGTSSVSAHITGVDDPDHWDSRACSVLGDAFDAPAYGTAPVARGWLALEQPGPWGRDAATRSHLDPDWGRALSSRLSAAGGRLVLVRRTGQHADDRHGGSRAVLVGSCLPGLTWLATGSLADPHELDTLDVEALSRGDLDATLQSAPMLAVARAPVFLVCTNGRRDVCCAVRGRPVAVEAAAARPGQVWETSHTGGHRFAPTGVLLPGGFTLARLHATDVVAALDAAAERRLPASLLGPRHDRGRSSLSAVQQAAESAVRSQTGQAGWDDVRVEVGVRIDDVTHHVPVSSSTGRWVAVVTRERGADRPVSCGKAAEPTLSYDVEVSAG